MKNLFFVIVFVGLSGFKTLFAQQKRIPGVAGFSNTYSNHKRPITRSEDKLPTSYSLKKYAPPVGDQGSTGTCVGWSTTYAGMTILENIKLNRLGDSLQQEDCFSQQLTYDICRFNNDYDCSSGLYPNDALDMLKSYGAVKLKNYPFICKDNNGENEIASILGDSVSSDSLKNFLSRIKANRLSDYISVSGASLLDNVKYYLSKNMPVIIAVEMYNSIESNTLSSVWTGVSDDYLGGHAMCVVGYDDSKEGGSFEILNSWGTEWCDKGYIWFRYSDFVKVVDEAYVLKGIEQSEIDTASVNSLDITLSLTSQNSSRLFKAEAANSYANRIIGAALDQQINFYYNEEDEFFKINLVSNNDEKLFVYLLNLKSNKVSLSIPNVNGKNFVEKSGNGLFIPSDQANFLKINKYDDGRNSYCLLLSTKLLDMVKLEDALASKTYDLAQFIEKEFDGQIAVNKLLIENSSRTKLNIRNDNEINQIFPIFLSFSYDNKSNLLFQNINFEKKPKKFSIYHYQSILYSFKKTAGYGYNMNLNVRKTLFGTKMRIKMIEKISLNNDLYLDEEDLESNLSFKVNGSLKKLPNKLKEKLVSKLVREKISFSYED